MLRIGIDFDNTIVDYRPIFAAAVPGLIAGKTSVRDALRSRPNGEAEWQRLQAHVYGTAIVNAPAFSGFDAFLRTARANAADIYIVSHKSRFAAADPQGRDLRQAASNWLEAAGIKVDGVYFEGTRAEKLARITDLRLTHFIDDLEDVLADAAFPKETRAILFEDSWDVVLRDVFG
ncbi:MAG TPA: hypothetical protein VGG22_05730 [Candidatus Baltobacteraceae bacterium]|jgi:hypothetical protein